MVTQKLQRALRVASIVTTIAGVPVGAAVALAGATFDAPLLIEAGRYIAAPFAVVMALYCFAVGLGVCISIPLSAGYRVARLVFGLVRSSSQTCARSGDQ